MFVFQWQLLGKAGVHGAVALSAVVKAALVKGSAVLSLVDMGAVPSLFMDRRLRRRPAKINPVAPKMQGWDPGVNGHHASAPAMLRVIQCHRWREKELAMKAQSQQMKN